jgi:hypothetical protein
VPGKVRDAWGKWRESRRQYQLERALYKMNGGATGAFAAQERAWDNNLAAGPATPRIDAPKSKAPDSPAA